MAKETMTPKERWLAVLQRKKPDRIPMDMWSTTEAMQKLQSHLGCNSERELYQRLHVDRVIAVSGTYTGPTHDEASGLPISADAGANLMGSGGTVKPEHADEFGCRYRYISYETGTYRECVFNPLAQYDSVAEIEANYTWPSPDQWDYSAIPDKIAEWETYPIHGGHSEPFLRYCRLRGLEQGFMDLLLNPEMVHYCLDRLFDLCYEDACRIYEQAPGKITITDVTEDMGSQENLLFSLEQIGEFLLPRMKRMMDLAHEAGVYVFHHDDGAVRPVIPALIELGIDILNPIQWRCPGMEREGLKRDFGDQIIFHGGVDNQQTLAFGSVQDVEQEVRENIDVLGKGGGYILAPCHNIQAVSPPENIVAMYETGFNHGR